jgi:hypothetical protein
MMMAVTVAAMTAAAVAEAVAEAAAAAAAKKVEVPRRVEAASLTSVV